MKQHITTIALFVLFFYCGYTVSFAQFVYQDSGKDATGVFQPRGATAYYTSGGRTSVPAYHPDGAFGALGKFDTAEDGWLRLATSGTGQALGYVVGSYPYPSSLGLTLEFDFLIWGVSDGSSSVVKIADGFSVFLYDGSINQVAATTDLAGNFRRGRQGGCMGYLPLIYFWKTNPNTTENFKGLKSAYLGVALDAYGNVHRHIQENVLRQAITSNAASYMRPNSLVLIGPSVNNVAGEPEGINGYKLVQLQSLNTTSKPLFRYTTNNLKASRPAPTAFYRRLKLELQPTIVNNVVTGMQVAVYIKYSQTGAYVKEMEGTINQAPPKSLKIGFAASTGGVTANMEVRNIDIRTPGIISAGKTFQECFTSYQDFEVNSLVTNFIRSTTTSINYSTEVKDELPINFVPTGYKAYQMEDTSSPKELTTVAQGKPQINLNQYTMNGNKRVYSYNLPLKEYGIVKIVWKGYFTANPPLGVFDSSLYLTSVPDYDDTDKDNQKTVKYSRFLGMPKKRNNMHYWSPYEATVLINPLSSESAIMEVEAQNFDPDITIKYQWEYADQDLVGGTWTQINGATSNIYTIPTTQYKSNAARYYRCKVIKEYLNASSQLTSCIQSYVTFKALFLSANEL